MNIQFPFFPQQLPPQNQFLPNIEQEVIKIKQQLAILNERLNKIEKTAHNNYLENDDNLHMM